MSDDTTKSTAPPAPPSRSREVLVALRRIMRAIDLHSRSLIQRFDLTGPQLMLLEEIAKRGEPTAGELSTAITLSQATVTGILNRLEKKGLIRRRRSEEDKRRVLVSPTPATASVLALAPPPLRESFVERFDGLADWEQTQILSSLQRLVTLMEAESIDVGPILATGPIVEEPPTG